MQNIKVSELSSHPRNTEFFDDMSGEKWKEFLESVKSRGVIVVLSTGVARKLLHEGYQIMDIKPHKQQKSRTVFVFIREGNIEQRISDLHLLEEKKSFHR